MPIVIPTTVDWSQTTIEVIRGALQLCQAIGVGENINDEDSDLCMTALDGVLKELPIHGYSWPQVAASPESLAWTLSTPCILVPPADYFGAPVLKYTDASGKAVELGRLSKPAFERLDLTETAVYPKYYYVSPDLSFNIWPAPTQDPGLTLTYQRIVPDLILTAPPDVQQQFKNCLQYLLADEISLKYGVPQAERQEIGVRASYKRGLLLQWATDQAPITIDVIDGCPTYPRSPLSW